MKLKTVRVRRSRPSPLALALALMLTMLCVYIISLPGKVQTQPTAASVPARAEVQMPGLQSTFSAPENIPAIWKHGWPQPAAPNPAAPG